MELTDSYSRVLPKKLIRRYEIREVRNATAVLQSTNPDAFADLREMLRDFKLADADILVPGGNEGSIAKRLNDGFRSRGWREGRFDLKIRSDLTAFAYEPAGDTEPTVETVVVANEGYKIDNVKGRVALDVEWNAKDGNLYRDVASYRALYDAAIIDLGIILTRTHDDLRALGRELGREKFLKTTTTTNLGKLKPMMSRGDSGGCPLLAVAITSRCYEPS